MQAQPAKAITIEQAKEYVRSTIQDMTTSLSQARQHLQEIQVSNSVQSGQVKRNLDLVDLARG
jgi:TATA-box binding protein (TBP) (component of TFIID and TFIIIB)